MLSSACYLARYAQAVKTRGLRFKCYRFRRAPIGNAAGKGLRQAEGTPVAMLQKRPMDVAMGHWHDTSATTISNLSIHVINCNLRMCDRSLCGGVGAR